MPSETRPYAAWLAVWCTGAVTGLAPGAINVGLRTAQEVYAPGEVVDVALVVVSDSPSGESLSSAQFILAWNIQDISLGSVDTGGLGWSVSGLVDDPYGINEAALPADGTAILFAVAEPPSPFVATPEGSLVATLRFNCLRETQLSSIEIRASEGMPSGTTAIFDAGIANLVVTGTLGSASFRIDDCLEDLNGDGSVGLQDLALLLANFGTIGNVTQGDIDGDEDIDLQDLSLLLAVFGLAC